MFVPQSWVLSVVLGIMVNTVQIGADKTWLTGGFPAESRAE